MVLVIRFIFDYGEKELFEYLHCTGPVADILLYACSTHWPFWADIDKINEV